MQEQIKRAKRAVKGSGHEAHAPAAVFTLVRPERGTARFELQQRAAVAAILNGFGELGWPQNLWESDIARLGYDASTLHCRIRAHLDEVNLSQQVPVASRMSCYRSRKMPGRSPYCLDASTFASASLTLTIPSGVAAFLYDATLCPHPGCTWVLSKLPIMVL